MKEMIRYGLILAFICGVATASLAVVNSVTRPRIIAQAQAEEDVSLKEVLPEAENFESVKSGAEIVYYKGYTPDAKFVGVAFKASGKGYSSSIETMVGMVPDGRITAIKVLSQNETPGLGAQVVEKEFTDRFKNKNIEGLNEIQGITGATISSKAVMNSVAKRAAEITELLKNER